MYNPSDIKRPSEFSIDAFVNPNHLYHCFGKLEYEIIAQRLLGFSQLRGKWVSLDSREFIPLFQDHAKNYLEEMAFTAGILTKNGEEFELTDGAIEVLAKKYPSERKES